MSRKRHRPEEIVAKLRQGEVLTAQGQSVAEAIRPIGLSASILRYFFHVHDGSGLPPEKWSSVRYGSEP